MSTKSFVIGSAGGDHIAVDIMGYEYQDTQDKHDANWLMANIALSANMWNGRIKKAFFTTGEITEFRKSIEKLGHDLKSGASLEPIEPYVVLKLSGDGRGKIEVSGVAFDEPGGVNALAFNWAIDNSFLPELIHQLKEVEKAFPPR